LRFAGGKWGTVVRRNGKAFWFNLPLLVYKVFLLSFNFFYLPTNSPRLYATLISYGDFSVAFDAIQSLDCIKSRGKIPLNPFVVLYLL